MNPDYKSKNERYEAKIAKLKKRIRDANFVIKRRDKRIEKLEENNNTRWYKLFGSPEKTVFTMSLLYSMLGHGFPQSPEAYLKWLKEEEEDND